MNMLYADDKPILVERSTTTYSSPCVFEPKTNCKNCGAPLDRNKDCPYCGTKRQMTSCINMTSDSISFYAG